MHTSTTNAKNMGSKEHSRMLNFSTFSDSEGKYVKVNIDRSLKKFIELHIEILVKTKVYRLFIFVYLHSSAIVSHVLLFLFLFSYLILTPNQISSDSSE